MKITPHFLALCISAGVAVHVPVALAESSVAHSVADSSTLTLLIEQALASDASRKQYFAQSRAMRESGIASSTLMDPKLKVGFGGVPIDSFRLDQDPMSNISLGLMQQFERGSTLELQAQKAGQQADGMALQIKARERQVADGITRLWLELGYQQQAASVLAENRKLLKELESFISTNYSIGKNQAQDLLNAQLQISKLDEKIQSNEQMQQRLIAQLSEWLGSGWLTDNRQLTAQNQLFWPVLEQKLAGSNGSRHYALLADHPMVLMADTAISASQTQVEIAEQAYLPQVGVEVMYAHRQANNMMGEPASDLVSAYLIVDIPLFTDNRQDKNHAAAQYQVGAARSQKDLLLVQLNSQLNALLSDKTNLEQRLERYQSSLLSQARARTRAVERGYQNNTSEFNDVIAAAADELALELERQRLVTDLNLVNSGLAALVGGFEYRAERPELVSNKLAGEEQ